MAQLLDPDVKDLGEFSVGRVLPNPAKRMVGPFVFFDHMGPATFQPGSGVNVRPHPHIGLATLTYLLEGSILHRDSLGNVLEILPGDVNWMIAGRGITHSERETIEVNSTVHRLDGVQCWVALPREHAEVAPDFIHMKHQDLPHSIYQGVTARLIIGEAYGMVSPIKTFSPMFLLDVTAHDGDSVVRPNPEHECLMYLATGSASVGGLEVNSGDTLLVDAKDDILVSGFSRMILFGGVAWPEAPHLYWNFVSFAQDRIEQAKQDWKRGRFPTVPGDARESIPLPDDD